MERSEVGRQRGEAEAEAMKECENEGVSVFNQSSRQQIISLCVVAVFLIPLTFENDNSSNSHRAVVVNCSVRVAGIIVFKRWSH